MLILIYLSEYFNLKTVLKQVRRNRLILSSSIQLLFHILIYVYLAFDIENLLNNFLYLAFSKLWMPRKSLASVHVAGETVLPGEL